MRAVFGREREQVLAIEDDAALRHFVFRVANEHIAQRAFARAVRPHEHVYFAVADCEVHAAQDFFAFDAGVQVFYFKHGYWGIILIICRAKLQISKN